jgi:hypothetical protein
MPTESHLKQKQIVYYNHKDSIHEYAGQSLTKNGLYMHRPHIPLKTYRDKKGFF